MRRASQILLTYLTTPHSITGAPTPSLMFKHQMPADIPSLTSSYQTKLDFQVNKRDAKQQSKIKAYPDEKRNTKIVNLAVGDEVLV